MNAEELSHGRAESSASTSGECMSRLRVTSDATSPAETRKPQLRRRRMQQRLETLTHSQLRLRHTLKKAFKRSNVHSCHKPALEQKGQLPGGVLQWVHNNLASCSGDQGMHKVSSITNKEGFEHRESILPEGYETLYKMESMPLCLKVPSLEQQRSRSGDLCVPVIPFQANGLLNAQAYLRENQLTGQETHQAFAAQMAVVPQLADLHNSSISTHEGTPMPFPMLTPPAVVTPARGCSVPLVHRAAPRRAPPPSPFSHPGAGYPPKPIASAGELLQRLSGNNFKILPEQPSSRLLHDPQLVYQTFSWEQAAASAQAASGHLLNMTAALPLSCAQSNYASKPTQLGFNAVTVPHLASGTSRAAGVPPAGYGALNALQTPFAESGPVQVDSKPNVPGSTVWGQHVNVEAEPSGYQSLLMAHFDTVPSVGVPRGLQPFYQ